MKTEQLLKGDNVMAQKTLYIVTFKDAAEWEGCPPSLIDRLKGMADRVAFAGSFGPIPDDEKLYGIATQINRALRGDKDIAVYGCLAEDAQRILSLLDTRKHKIQKFSFKQVRFLLGV
jgi:hypothetical protein